MDETQVDWSTQAKGDSLPEMTRGPITQEMLKSYAKASGDENPIHLDPEAAKQMGLPGVIAHGMLSMGFMGDYAAQLAGDLKRVKSLKCQCKSMTFLGDLLTLCGSFKEIEIKEQGQNLAICQIQVKNQKGEITCQGEARIQVDL